MIELIVAAFIVIAICVCWRSEERFFDNARPWFKSFLAAFALAVVVLAILYFASVQMF
jgi:hypothetical protein